MENKILPEFSTWPKPVQTVFGVYCLCATILTFIYFMITSRKDDPNLTLIGRVFFAALFAAFGPILIILLLVKTVTGIMFFRSKKWEE